MLNKSGERELAYVVKVGWVRPIEEADNIELIGINGWTCIAKIGEFKEGDLAVYFEIDSKLPEADWSEFMASKGYKVKTMKLNKFKVISQGLALPASAFGAVCYQDGDGTMYIHFDKKSALHENIDLGEGEFLTKKLGVTYAVEEDNARKANVNPDAKINSALARHPKIAKKFGKAIKKNKFLRFWFLFLFGKKKDSETAFPTKFQYVHKTDQERCENMIWVLEDKTPYVVTQKCDGSSGTYILERKPFGKFEFYVCSRNVRQLTPNQKSYYDDNHYWNVAFKYDLENKMKDYMKKHPDISYLCWQGEVCAPQIQKNPQGLTEEHLFLFHCTDSNGRWAMLDAIKMWKEYGLETVPVVDENYILPDDFEKFKLSADGYYDPSVCEGKTKQEREGFVYYKTTDPNFSFKNVSREYLAKHSN